MAFCSSYCTSCAESQKGNQNRAIGSLDRNRIVRFLLRLCYFCISAFGKSTSENNMISMAFDCIVCG